MKSVSKNYIYNMMYNVLNMLLPLVTTPYLARVLGTAGVGSYAYYFSIAQYFTLFAKLGLTNYGTRHLAMVRDDEEKLKIEFTTLYIMQVIVSCIVTSFYIGFCVFFADIKLYAILFVIWVFAVVFDTDWLLFSLEDFRTAAIRNCVVKIFSALLVFWLVKSTSDVWKYVLIVAISYALGYFSLWIKCKKYILLNSVDLKKIIPHIKPCAILMVPVIALSIYRTMDKVMLGTLSDMNQTGLYEYAEKVIYCLTAFIASLGQVMMPRMANLVVKNEQKRSFDYIKNSMRFIMFLSTGMCFGVMSLSDSLIPILYGDEFEDSIILMKLLSITLIFIAWGNVIRSQYVIPNKKDNIYISTISMGALCNLGVNAILIPHYGAVGACIGTICAELLVPICQVIVIRNKLPYVQLLKLSCPFWFFGGIMYIVCELIEKVIGVGVLCIVLQTLVGTMLYMGISVVYMKNRKVCKIYNK